MKAGLLWQDEEGCEFGDIEAARRCAVQRARAICRTRSVDPDGSIEVTSDDGTVILVVSFAEATARTVSSTLH